MGGQQDPEKNRARFRRNRLIDRWAARFITLSGVTVVTVVVGILVLVLREAWPLLPPAKMISAHGAISGGEGAGSGGPESGFRPAAMSVETDLHGQYLVIGQLAATGEARVFVAGRGNGASGGEWRAAQAAFRKNMGAAAPPEGAADPVSPPAPADPSPPRVAGAWPLSQGRHAVLWDDGAATLMKFHADFSEKQASFDPLFDDPGFGKARLAALDGDDENGAAVFALSDGAVLVHRWVTRRAGLRRVATRARWRLAPGGVGSITSLAIAQSGALVAAGTATGELLLWSVPEEAPAAPEEAPRRPVDPAGNGNGVAIAAAAADRAADASPSLTYPRLPAHVFPANRDRRSITALAFLAGEATLVCGDGLGRLQAWHVGRSDGRPRLTQTVAWKETGRPVAAILPSTPRRTFAAFSADGSGRLCHSTTGSELLSIAPPDAPAEGAEAAVWAFSGRGDALTREAGREAGSGSGSGAGGLEAWFVSNPHPETSLKGLFGRVHYENYSEPAWVWQSSGVEDSEPKLSLVPLLLGTVKGAVYAMFFALPLSMFAAIYVSQFARTAFREWIKPAVELMAAVPSVVVGFLAALWLAPRLEGALLAIPLAAVIVPVFGFLFLLAWQRLRRRPWAGRVERGGEFLAAIPPLAVGILLALAAAPLLESTFFDGDFPRWLFESPGLRHDQRNAVVIAFALGFAVIPLVFSLAEDAITSVPPVLGAGALALGASRWQAVWRVVVPAALPGLFAAAMLGFGRAVGETMIVLMATGNTPVMDFSPFTGMRTLSANIAVEMPEAPVGGTLYRTLFLCAALLFLFTFVFNAAAELVRRRLAKRYGRL